jgi:hypothetical protein
MLMACGCCNLITCCRFSPTLSGRGRVVYDDLSEREQQELQQLVARYLTGESWAVIHGPSGRHQL